MAGTAHVTLNQHRALKRLQASDRTRRGRGRAAADLLSVALTRGVGLTPLQTVELKTYDWRLARTARPETARQDIALVEIDEYSFATSRASPAGWPWPRFMHSMIIDFLARGPAKVIAYDLDFAGDDTRQGFKVGDATCREPSPIGTGQVRPQRRNVILLADATYEATTGSTPPYLATPFTRLLPTSPSGAKSCLLSKHWRGPAPALDHNLFVLDPTA